jgi:gamma-glutamylcyclotransferase (GGCT)/AIG2-like uncharacterized protein YtfP
MFLFSYGSNSIEQLKDRLSIDRVLLYKKAYMKDYIRIFAGKSNKWNGCVASIYPKKDKKVYGIAIEISEDEINKLNAFESGYSLEIKKIIIEEDKEEIDCYVYIKKNNKLNLFPSESYLSAINKMLNNRIHKKNRKIMIRVIKNNKLVLLGFWTIENGFSYIIK